MFLKITLFTASVLMMACASTHPGKLGRTDSGSASKLPLVISAKLINNSDSEAFELLEVTLENTSDKWLRLNQSEVVITGDMTSQLSVVVGQDLRTWAEAAALREKVDRQNKDVLQTGLILGGAIAMAGSGKNKSLGDAGALMALGGYSWVVADAVNNSINKAEGIESVPENHLYRPVTIPGKMYLRRWVLINKPSDKKLQSVTLRFKNIEGDEDTYVIPLQVSRY